MATGMRDAFGLSWRLGYLLRKDQASPLQHSKHQWDILLKSWASERRRGADESSRLTEANGSMLLGKSCAIALLLQLGGGILNYAPNLRDWAIQKQLTDGHGFLGAEHGFFLDGSSGLGKNREGSYGGGQKIAQVYMKSSPVDSQLALSDQFFWRKRNPLTLLLLRHVSEQESYEIKLTLNTANLPVGFLATEILVLNDNQQEFDDSGSSKLLDESYKMITPSEVGDPNGPKLRRHYNASSFRRRFQPGALCALVRPDWIIFSQAYSAAQLQTQFLILQELLSCDSASQMK